MYNPSATSNLFKEWQATETHHEVIIKYRPWLLNLKHKTSPLFWWKSVSMPHKHSHPSKLPKPAARLWLIPKTRMSLTISMSKFSYLQVVLMHPGSRNGNGKFSILMYEIHSTFSLLHWVTERFRKNVTVFEIKTYLTIRGPW